ncbi:type VI secretion system baseplate subunit TssE [Roseibium litorale]|uniref:Type VI secretion system baseplate subunit TssE n=1 Tax=Roseibium litorale TaxID=2803841 RepID=A0ABR9CLL4_9HYPH|nr:type VI secretion system baseplate subunit TssE [Roseibium litorale]MBD8891295.1 type VI secretion system baseplate subunit TssE [Roseibium litorale]
MVDRLLSERLQPSLLDRLTDDAPEETREAGSSRFIDLARLRQIIQRDLSWLLNTSNIEAVHDLELRPQTACSVLNYGIPDLSGTVRTSRRAVEICQAIRRAIETFEPRILPQTLDVAIRRDEKSSGAVLSFDIRGEMWAEPVPVDIYLRTALDVTTGEIVLKRQG